VRFLRFLAASENRLAAQIFPVVDRLVDCLFVVCGPIGIAFFTYALLLGYWIAVLGIVIGAGMTWVGWGALIRFVRSRG
jgi:hypothetical protein